MSSLYIHIPFCKRKCNYCDFVSYADKEHLIDDYVEALIKEINSPPCQHGSNPPPSLFKRGGKEGGEFSTIYFGGGTPTLLDIKYYEKILGLLKMKFIFNNDIEITVEANPGTADKTKLKELRQLGINRLSIGAQSFNDSHLKTLGRIHNSQEIFKFYDDARAVGFDNINLDLIFALPDQTLDQWKNDLRTAIALMPHHLSAYNLQIEEGTPFNLQLTTNNLQRPNEDTELAMYEFTIETLWLSGYKHYEISNFALPNRECQHNLNYWKNGNYLGIGAGAHSHFNGKRWANPNSVEEYIKAAPRPTPNDSPDAPDQRETLFMGLRLLDGISLHHFKGFEQELADLINSGLLTRENSHIKLTRRGLYLANEVFERFV